MNILSESIYGITNSKGDTFYNYYCEGGTFSECYADKIKVYFYSTKEEANKAFNIMKHNMLEKNLELQVVEISMSLNLKPV